MLQKFKDLVQASLKPFGYRLRLVPADHTHPIDLRDGVNDPRALLYHGNPRPVLINAPIDKGYALDSFPLDPDGPHPFVCAVREGRNSEYPRQAIAEVLREYYSLVQPNSAAEWLGVSETDVPEFADVPAWMRIFPWRNVSLLTRRKAIELVARRENEEHGLDAGADAGWRAFGPVSEDVLQVEVERLYGLMKSISENGLLRHNEPHGDIRAVALVDENGEWRWQTDWGGQHRVAALTAMDYKLLPVRIWRVVFRNHVSHWPNVSSGLYTENAALDLFDRIFDRQIPPPVQTWEEAVSSKE